MSTSDDVTMQSFSTDQRFHSVKARARRAFTSNPQSFFFGDLHGTQPIPDWSLNLLLLLLLYIITVYCYVVWSNEWPALMGSGPSGNPPLYMNILYCMLLMCLQVVNKRSLSLSLSLENRPIKQKQKAVILCTSVITHQTSLTYTRNVCSRVCDDEERINKEKLNKT